MGRILKRWKDKNGVLMTQIRDDKYKPLFSKRVLEQWRSFDNLYGAFKDPQEKYQPRTWAQLQIPTRAQKDDGIKTRFAKSSLSRMLRELVKSGYITADLRINGTGKCETLYRILKEWAPQITQKIAIAKLKMNDGTKKDLGQYWDKKIYKHWGKPRMRLSIQEKALFEKRVREAKEVEKNSP